MRSAARGSGVHTLNLLAPARDCWAAFGPPQGVVGSADQVVEPYRNRRGHSSSPGDTEEVCEDARSLGIKVSPRTVTDYVEAGLLAPPLHRKTTQRGSDRRIFPPEQRRLFHALNAAKLRSPLARVPHRNVIPVVLYVWCMNDTVVPDVQARRALRTWAQSVGIRTAPQEHRE